MPSKGRAFADLLNPSGLVKNVKLEEGAVVGGGSNTTTYADMAALVLATGMSDGDQAFVLANNNLYIYKTNGWFKIATVENLQPGSISGVSSSYTLATDGTPTVITATATDPEGFPLTWSYAVTTGSLGSTATVSQTDNVFTITPSTTEADAGEFSITFSVTDGVNTAVNAVGDFGLSFGPIIESFAVSDDITTYTLNGQPGLTAAEISAGRTDITFGTKLGSAQFNGTTYAGGSDPNGSIYYCEMSTTADYHVLSLWDLNVRALNTVYAPYERSAGYSGIYGGPYLMANERVSMLLDQPNGKLHFWKDGVYDAANSGDLPAGTYHIVAGDGSSSNAIGPGVLIADNTSGAATQWVYDPSTLYANIP